MNHSRAGQLRGPCVPPIHQHFEGHPHSPTEQAEPTTESLEKEVGTRGTGLGAKSYGFTCARSLNSNAHGERVHSNADQTQPAHQITVVRNSNQNLRLSGVAAVPLDQQQSPAR